MALLEAVLFRINDTERVVERMEKSSALRELVEGYQHYTFDDATLVNVSSIMTGAEFKEALRRLKPEIQVTLLKKYCDTLHGVAVPAPVVVPAVTTEPEAQIEERRNRHWMIKLCGILLSSILLIMVATFASVVAKGVGADSSVFTSAMTNIVEIAKLVFGLK